VPSPNVVHGALDQEKARGLDAGMRCTRRLYLLRSNGNGVVLAYLVLLVAAVSIYPEPVDLATGRGDFNGKFNSQTMNWTKRRGFWAERASRGSFAIDDRQHPQRVGPHAHYGPSAPPK
jgi:hypothetical protein